MSFEGDKKREHAALADQAMQEGDLRKGAFHLAKTAEFALKLSEKTEGKIRRGFVQEARELVEVAEEIQAKARTVKKESREAEKKPVQDSPPDKEDGSEGSSDWLVTEKPEVRLSDIAGMEEVKRKLAEMVIEPMKHPDKA